MQFLIRVGDQVAVLLEVVSDGDHVAVAFDHQRLVTLFLKAHMEGVLVWKSSNRLWISTDVRWFLERAWSFWFLHESREDSRPPLLILFIPTADAVFVGVISQLSSPRRGVSYCSTSGPHRVRRPPPGTHAPDAG